MSQRVAHGKRGGCSHGREEVPRRSEPRGRRAPPRLLAVPRAGDGALQAARRVQGRGLR